MIKIQRERNKAMRKTPASISKYFGYDSHFDSKSDDNYAGKINGRPWWRFSIKNFIEYGPVCRIKLLRGDILVEFSFYKKELEISSKIGKKVREVILTPKNSFNEKYGDPLSVERDIFQKYPEDITQLFIGEIKAENVKKNVEKFAEWFDTTYPAEIPEICVGQLWHFSDECSQTEMMISFVDKKFSIVDGKIVDVTIIIDTTDSTMSIEYFMSNINKSNDAVILRSETSDLWSKTDGVHYKFDKEKFIKEQQLIMDGKK